MAKEKKSNGGTNGDSGAPAEARATEAQQEGMSSVPLDGPQAFSYRDDATEMPTSVPQDIPPDAQEPSVETPQAASPVDIEAVQQRFIARLPDLLDLRAKLEKIEADHEADGDIIAEMLVAEAKASKASPTIELGGILWRAKHDVEKRGGKPHLHELVKHKPLTLGRKPS